MKKKSVLVLVLSLVMCMALFGCGGSDSGSDEGSEPANPNKIGDFEVTVDNCELTTDYDGADAVKISFTFTNNSEEAADFATAMMVTVYQDGVEQEMAIVADGDDSDWTSIKPGASLTVTQAYSVANTTSDVEVEVEEFLGSTDEKVAKTFKLQ